MSIVSETITALGSSMPVAVGMYEPGEDYPEKYIVITPGYEENEDIADDTELTETETADVNLYCKGNYETTKNTIKGLLKSAGFFFLDRRYITYEQDTGHHHYVFTIGNKEVLNAE